MRGQVKNNLIQLVHRCFAHVNIESECEPFILRAGWNLPVGKPFPAICSNQVAQKDPEKDPEGTQGRGFPIFLGFNTAI